MTLETALNLLATLPGKPSWDDDIAALYSLHLADWHPETRHLAAMDATVRCTLRPTLSELRDIALRQVAPIPSIATLREELRLLVLFHRPAERARHATPLLAALADELGGWREFGMLDTEEMDRRFPSAAQRAHTEHLRAYNNAALETYRTGWQWMATLGSSRTCPYCLAMHGTIYSLEEPFIGHVQCRCTPVSITRSGPPITQDGESWLREQSTATQEAILGKAAAKAWRKGEVSLSDFAGTKDKGDWGQQGYVRSLREAQKRQAS